MQYKALILDVDGTLIGYQDINKFISKNPSQRVITAIKKASEKVTICLATGRSYQKLLPLLDTLNLSGFAVTNDGARVVDTKTKKVVYQKTIDLEALKQVIQIIQTLSIPFYLTDGDGDFKHTLRYQAKEPLNVFADELFTEQEVDVFIAKLSHIPSLVVHKTQHGDGRKFGFLISHAEATKLHGIYKIARLLGINTKAIIGVGDGYNDFPLLMACGLKVAMGNANSELKQIADYIAPSIEKDGVADVIKRFILNTPYKIQSSHA